MGLQEAVLLTFLGALISLIFSIISFFIFRGVKKKDDTEETKREKVRGELEKLWKEVRALKPVLEKRIIEGEEKGSTLRREIYARLRDLESRREECRDMFLGRMEWEKIEGIKEQSLAEWKDQNKRLEDTMKTLMGLLKKNGNGG